MIKYRRRSDSPDAPLWRIVAKYSRARYVYVLDNGIREISVTRSEMWSQFEPVEVAEE